MKNCYFISRKYFNGRNNWTFTDKVKFTKINYRIKKQGSTNVFILAYTHVYTSNKLGVRISTDNLLLTGLPLTNSLLFPLQNATIGMPAKNVSIIPTKYIWKDISLNISIKCISEKVFPKSSVIISIHILKPERGTLDQRKKLLLTPITRTLKGVKTIIRIKKQKLFEANKSLGYQIWISIAFALRDL